jgi:SulP family sulfate permease
VRVDAQFYFGNVSFLKDWLKRIEARTTEPLRAVVIDAAGMNQIDSSAETALRELADDYARRGVALYLAEVKGPVRDVLARSGFDEALGRDRFTLSVHDAVVRACGDGCRGTEALEEAEVSGARLRAVG